jgi:oligopeptidase A
MTNPLLDFTDLPRFADILPEHIAPAIDELIAKSEAAQAAVTKADTPATWDKVATPLALATEQLSRAWGCVGHMHAVVDTPELRAAYTEMLPKVTAFWTKLGADAALYAKYQAIMINGEFTRLNAEQQRAVTLFIRNFKLGGADLQGEAKERFAKIKDAEAKNAQAFEEHVMDATDAYAYYASADELQGLPDDVKQGMAEAAKADNKTEQYKITLHMPSYMPVMQYATNRALREQVYHAYATRASEFGDAKLDNTALIPAQLALRSEEAQLLNFNNYAELSLAPKMADTPEQVIAFIREIASRAKPYAERDMHELRSFAKSELGMDDVQPWDVTFISEKLREARYAFSEQEVKQYFTEPKVIAGLFKVVETLFSVRIKPDTAPLWHKDVSFYRVESLEGSLIGQFYFDLYARAGKRPGAWMDECRSRWSRPQGALHTTLQTTLQTPVTYLTCNFPAPSAGKPATFSHDDVQTLFHEFGHGLHLLLTQTTEPSVGMTAVEWDAIELPSQFMENFCWEWDVVKHMTSHIDTDEQMPKALFDKMLAAKNFQAGMQTARQMEFSLFDMLIHARGVSVEALNTTAINKILNTVRDEIAVIKPPAYHRFQNSFAHIFASGYAAGYYSYKWAEVLSADAYAAFEEATQGKANTLDVATGERYRNEILGAGAKRTAMDSFKSFRGREPKIDALLRHQGMAA